jgi:Zn-dependent protease
LAGPGAGFVLAALIVMTMRLLGHQVGIAWSGEQLDLEMMQLERVLVQPLGLFVAYFEPLGTRTMNFALGDLLQVNILWGLVNLLPIYPLDGGQISRELFTLRSARSGIVQSLQLSFGTAILVALYAIVERQIFLCVMFGALAYSSYQALQSYRNSWR